jgi:hypothetical protein
VDEQNRLGFLAWGAYLSTLWGLILVRVFIIIDEVKGKNVFGFANIAQLVEQLIRNHQVAGSIPVVGTILHWGNKDNFIV